MSDERRSVCMMDNEFANELRSFAEFLQRRLPDIQVRDDPAAQANTVAEVERKAGTFTSASDKKEQQEIVACETWKNNIYKVLWTENEIGRRVHEMARQISKDYAGEKIIAVGLLKGAVMFATDLLRRLTVGYELDFIRVSSYHGTKSSGNVLLSQDMSINPEGRHILIVEDLIDTGTTLKWILEHLQSKKAKSVRIACLLDKVECRKSSVKIDYTGWECPNEFVVGYGMDFNDEYRCLPFVGVLRPEAYGA